MAESNCEQGDYRIGTTIMPDTEPEILLFHLARIAYITNQTPTHLSTFYSNLEVGKQIEQVKNNAGSIYRSWPTYDKTTNTTVLKHSLYFVDEEGNVKFLYNEKAFENVLGPNGKPWP